MLAPLPSPATLYFQRFCFLQNLLRYLISLPPPLSLFSGRHLALITRMTAATRADLTECSLCTSHNNPLRPVLLYCNFIDEMLTLRLSSSLHASCIDRAGIKPRSEMTSLHSLNCLFVNAKVSGKCSQLKEVLQGGTKAGVRFFYRKQYNN